MKTATVAELGKDISSYLTEVEKGETIRVVQDGKHVADIVPVGTGGKGAWWKRPRKRLNIPGVSLSEEIIKARREAPR